DEREVKLFMSHRGQMRWFSYRVFDEPWKISKAAPSADGGSLQLDLSGPSEVISSSANVVSISNSGAMLRRSLASSSLPHWSSATIGRQPTQGGFPDSPAQQMKEVQIPYWPGLTLAVAW